MSVKKVFWENPYMSEIEAIVMNVDGNIVTLDQTIAFAFSGGQQSDSGTINGFKITDAKKEGNEIFYTLEKNHNLKQNQSVIVYVLPTKQPQRYCFFRSIYNK